METTIFEDDDDKFIRHAVKFCNAIDKYRETLRIDAKEVAMLKGDVNIVVYISSRYPSFTPSFIQYNIKALRNRFAGICQACVRSKKYNRYMGIELGIETIGAERTFSAELIGAWFMGVLNGAPQQR